MGSEMCIRDRCRRPYSYSPGASGVTVVPRASLRAVCCRRSVSGASSRRRTADRPSVFSGRHFRRDERRTCCDQRSDVSSRPDLLCSTGVHAASDTSGTGRTGLMMVHAIGADSVQPACFPRDAKAHSDLRLHTVEGSRTALLGTSALIKIEFVPK